ncbi:ead/Ea22-like family protein [Escherichia coli]
MSKIDYQALREAAEKATPGEWCTDDHYGVIADTGLNANYYIASCLGPDNRSNKRFIAAANPAAVLTLLNELETAKKRIAELEAEPVSQTYKLNELSGNSPVTPDGWISCSDRMPEKYDFDIWVFSPSRGVLDGLQWDGSMFTDDEYQFVIHDATHWMRKAYPAAPQQDGE